MVANLTTKLGQLVDVLTPDTTNTRIGVANASPTRTLDVTGTFGASGASTLGGALTYGGVTLSNAVTGTGNMVLSAAPTLTGTLTAAAANFSGAQTNTVAGVPYQWTGNGATVYPSFTGGGAVEYNFSNGNAEVDFWNTANSPTRSFMWRQQTGASSNTLLMSLTPAGHLLVGTGTGDSGILSLQQDQNAVTRMQNTNSSSGASATADMLLYNGTNYVYLSQQGTGYTASGLFRQDGAILTAVGAGGLTLATGAAQPIYFGINNVEKMRLDASGNLCVGTTTATGRLNISGGSIYNSTSGVGNTAGPVAITIPNDTDGFILINAVQSGVGKVSYIVHYMNVSTTVTSNTVSTLVTGTSPITAITPGTNVITLTLFAANTNVNWGMYNGPRG
jgi:hypothetical protein